MGIDSKWVKYGSTVLSPVTYGAAETSSESPYNAVQSNTTTRHTAHSSSRNLVTLEGTQGTVVVCTCKTCSTLYYSNTTTHKHATLWVISLLQSLYYIMQTSSDLSHDLDGSIKYFWFWKTHHKTNTVTKRTEIKIKIKNILSMLLLFFRAGLLALPVLQFPGSFSFIWHFLLP